MPAHWKLTLLLFALAGAVDAADPVAETRPVAEQALVTFRKLATPANSRALGFDSVAQLQTQSRLGEPPFLVRLMQPGPQPVSPVNKVIWPVVIGTTVRSSITVERYPAGWRATRYGAPNLTRQLTLQRELRRQATGLPLTDFELLDVPGLATFLFRYRLAGVEQFTPLTTRPALGLRAGEPLTAPQLLHRVSGAPPRYLLPHQ